jgi:hypothetical protein
VYFIEKLIYIVVSRVLFVNIFAIFRYLFIFSHNQTTCLLQFSSAMAIAIAIAEGVK